MTHATIRTTMSGADWALLLVLSLLWGTSFFFIEIAVAEIAPLSLVSLRVGLAALTLWGLILVLGVPLPRWRAPWGALALMGLANNALPFTLIVWAQTSIPSGLASILNASTPLFAVIVAGLVLSDERATRGRIAGVLIGLAGVVLMVGADSLSGLGQAVLPQLAVLGAALAYACASVYGRRFRRLGVAPLVTAAGQVTSASLALIPLALLVEQPWLAPAPGWAAMGATLALALPSTALAYILYFRLLATAGATNLMLVTILVPVTAILLGVAFLGERLSTSDILGMALIVLGLSVIDGRLWRRAAASPP